MPKNQIVPLSSFYEISPESWESAKQIGMHLSSHVFRGHSDNSWQLKTTLERAAEKYMCPPNMIGGQEKLILQNFKSRAHQFIQSPPGNDDFVEWLSIIQDFGGPTRLLDCTISFYLASFFAMETAEKDACVWAISYVTLAEQAYKKFNCENMDSLGNLISDYMRTSFDNSLRSENFVLFVRPPRLNERLAVQKGLFLFPCNLRQGFENNLCNTFGFPFPSLVSYNAIKMSPPYDKERLQRAKIIKINLPRKIHCDAILDLDAMNINAASLFPDLSGFARSLWSSMRYLERLGIPLKKK